MPIFKKPDSNFLYQNVEDKIGILHTKPVKCNVKRKKLRRVIDGDRGPWIEGTEYIDTEKPMNVPKTYLCRKCAER